MDAALLNRTAIVGVGYTPMVRKSDRSLSSVAAEAAINAIRDAGLKGSDIDGYVRRASEHIAQTVQLPPGYYIQWAGQFEYLKAAETIGRPARGNNYGINHGYWTAEFGALNQI